MQQDLDQRSKIEINSEVPYVRPESSFQFAFEDYSVERLYLENYADPTLLQKFKRKKIHQNISVEAYDMQSERLQQIVTLFQKELQNERVTLTPRELFFILFGGMQEYEQKKAENPQFCAFDFFEFQISDSGRSWMC